MMGFPACCTGMGGRTGWVFTVAGSSVRVMNGDTSGDSDRLDPLLFDDWILNGRFSRSSACVGSPPDRRMCGRRTRGATSLGGAGIRTAWVRLIDGSTLASRSTFCFILILCSSVVRYATLFDFTSRSARREFTCCMWARCASRYRFFCSRSSCSKSCTFLFFWSISSLSWDSSCLYSLMLDSKSMVSFSSGNK